MSDIKSIPRVLGLAFNYTDYINMGQLAVSGKLVMDYESEKFPLADRAGKKTIITNRDLRFEGVMREITTQWLERFTGGTVATGGIFYYRETVTKVTNDLTLTHGSGGTESMVGVVRCYDTVNKSDRAKVASSPVAQNSYTLSGKVLTLNASDTGTIFEITYLYADSATADGKLIIPGQTMPGQFRMLFTYDLVNPDTAAVTRMVIDCQKCVYTGPLEIGGDVQSYFGTPCNLDIINEADGDVVIYPNGYNPAF